MTRIWKPLLFVLIAASLAALFVLDYREAKQHPEGSHQHPDWNMIVPGAGNR